MARLAAVWLALAVALCHAAEPAGPVPAPDTAAHAQRILRATSVKGGLIVHLGCGDGKLTAALRAGDSYLVHGLDTSGDNVRQAREHICAKGRYGPVAVDTFDGKHLPYADNLVNLLVARYAHG